MTRSKIISVVIILMTLNGQFVIGLPHFGLDYMDMSNSKHATSDSILDFESIISKTLEFKKANEKHLNESVNACKYAPIIETESNEMIEDTDAKCYGTTIDLDLGIYYANRIFLINDLTIGIISSSGQSIGIYRILTPELNLELMHTKYFNHFHVPFDACADLNQNIFVLSQEKLTKYKLNENFIPIKMKSILIESSAISCHDNKVYVNDRLKNQIKVYNGSDLELIDSINVKGVVLSMHHALAIDKNVKTYVDGLDGVALLLDEEITSQKSCHFYKNMMCIEDIDVLTESKTNSSSIYVVDGCDKDVKQFVYTPNKRIVLENKYKIGHNLTPTSMIKNSLNYLIVLTNYPSKINILDLNQC